MGVDQLLFVRPDDGGASGMPATRSGWAVALSMDWAAFGIDAAHHARPVWCC